jgi:pimeloyl-ACP methyl ester carboxylesterase
MNPGAEVPAEREVAISLGAINLKGTLSLPLQAMGVVLFVHGSGSSRFSSRNRYVARTLNDAGIATLLFDLLSADEERVDEVTAELRFNIPLLTGRVLDVTGWLRENETTRDLPLGYFGASTGAAAALAAAARTDDVAAVVSRGGRPDLALPYLPQVEAPVLLIVGGRDSVVIDLNREAYAALHSLKELVIVPGATHLFEEPGKLEEVARLATGWFRRHLSEEVT